jgi:hypothetical protein
MPLLSTMICARDLAGTPWCVTIPLTTQPDFSYANRYGRWHSHMTNSTLLHSEVTTTTRSQCRIFHQPVINAGALAAGATVKAGRAICGSPASSNFATTVKFGNNSNDGLITGGHDNLKQNNKLRVPDDEDKLTYCGILRRHLAGMCASRPIADITMRTM